MGLIPDWGTKIPQATQLGKQNKTKQKQNDAIELNLLTWEDVHDISLSRHKE